ncbi:DUF3592 domain-containing protein [Reinekea marinisedimentorum]|uniref:Uncharacterized protein DUF3592 n=1 Tax=Reinekea marinisedimentorum TaxID=230495 RepID=A0A4R3I776_9GAMM|nr:DUF3592 domain-containing protein [Reinekea marinisedimentorum]TCS41079.1 uncharacterized protein DUF3592 [Reinekea marinisedimentorum]
MKFQKPNLFLLLFSLPFFSVGVGFLVLSIIPSLYLAATVPHWQQVPAQLEYANLATHYGDDSTSYLAEARYRYQVGGVSYVSERVGIATSADNVGNWQLSTGHKLERLYASQQPVMAYVNPSNPERAMLFPQMRWGLFAFKMIFVVVFGGFGAGMMLAAFIKSPSARVKSKHKGKPVKQHQHSDAIYSGARAKFWIMLVMALVFTAVSIAVSMVIPRELQSGNKAILLVLIFPFATLFMIVSTVKEANQLLRFGRSPLILSPSPAGIGGHLNATIDINTPHRSNQHYRVTLCCVNRRRTGSGKNSSTSETIKWVEEGVAYPELNSQGGTRLRFAFNIPNKLPETEEASHNYHFWRLDLEADIAGTLLKRSFNVPVQQVQNPQPAQRYLATENPLMPSLNNSRIDALDMEDRSHEIEFYVPRFSYFKDRSFSFLFGAIFLGSGIGVSIAGAPFIFTLIFVPIGSIFCLASLYTLLTSIRTMVREDGIYRQTSFLGLYKKNSHISFKEFSDFTLKPAMMWQNAQGARRHFFAIVARSDQKKKITVVERVEGKGSAESLIRRFEGVMEPLKF